MARDTWYRLDNIGKFYAAQAGLSEQTVFRYSATLVDEVDPTVLQHALERAVAMFPSFNVCLRSGVFWHYLEQSGTVPRVQQEDLPICFGLHVNARSVLFRVSYYRARVNFEVSHIVSDGRGSLAFFRALLCLYLGERYGVEGVDVGYDGSDFQKAEDSFDKYFERDKAASTKMPRAYRLGGWRDETDPTYMELHLPVGEVLALAHEWGVSMTSALIGVLMASIREEMPLRHRDRAISLDVPVDLRRHFKSTTSKNFFGLAFVSYVPGEADESVEDIARTVNSQLRDATSPEKLKLRMNRMVALEKNPLLRLAPLFAKDAVLALANRFAELETTTTMSNIGAVRIDERVARYVRDVNILTSTRGLNFTVCSFGDDLSVGISTVFSNLNVVKNFCRFFTRRGMRGTLNISKTREEVEQDQQEVAFERMIRQAAERGRDAGERDPGAGRGQDDAPAADGEGAPR